MSACGRPIRASLTATVKSGLPRRLAQARTPRLCLLLGLFASTLSAQEFPSSSETPSTQQTQVEGAAPARPTSERQSGDDAAGVQSILDSFDLGSGAMDWRGKQFNLGDAGMARARFEKYLNSPPLTSEDDLTYDTLLTEISHRLIGQGGCLHPNLQAVEQPGHSARPEFSLRTGSSWNRRRAERGRHLLADQSRNSKIH